MIKVHEVSWFLGDDVDVIVLFGVEVVTVVGVGDGGVGVEVSSAAGHVAVHLVFEVVLSEDVLVSARIGTFASFAEGFVFLVV